MMQELIKKQTKLLGLEVIKLIDELPHKPSTWANYRAACTAKSSADFINKLKIVEEETDETHYWIEILEESGLIESARIASLKKEVNEILSIVVASIKTSRVNNQKL